MNVNSSNPAAAQGWIKAKDPKSGRTYYANTGKQTKRFVSQRFLNAGSTFSAGHVLISTLESLLSVTRKTQWDAPPGWEEEEFPPLLPPEDSDDEEELPPGWEVMHDPTTGKPFYVDHKRKITQWTRPKIEKKATQSTRNSPAVTLSSSAAMARVLEASSSTQPRSYFQEAAYFQPAHSGTAGEVDLSDSMPALDFTVRKVADKYRLECPHCDSLFTLSKRRHHCRLCGDVFCDACSSHRVSLPLEGAEFEKPVRICDFCNKDVEQGNFFSMRRYLTPLTLYDPENGEDDEESGVATYTNVNAALAALTLDLDQILQNAEGFEEKVTIPTDVLIPNIIKHLSARSDTYERAVRALASLLSLGSMVGKSDYAHAVFSHGGKNTLDQVLWILERSGSDRRTLFVQEKAAQVMFYLVEPRVISSIRSKEGDSTNDIDGAAALDIQRCLRNMIDHSSSTKNPNLQRWATATVRNLVVEDQRRSCLAINEVAARIASGEVSPAPEYESFLDQLVSTGGIMILCSLIGADDSDTRAHATGALDAILNATRTIDGALSALEEMRGGIADPSQRKDGDIVRAITAGSGFGSSVSQLLLSADDSVASMGCNFVASLVMPILTDPEGSATLPDRYDCRSDSHGLGACREAALEVASGGCLPALLSLVQENGRLTRPVGLRCLAMETFAATAVAICTMGKAWADGKYEEGMAINNAPALLTRAMIALNEEQGIDVALAVVKSASSQLMGSQHDTPTARIQEAAGVVLAAITSCSSEAIMNLNSRQILSSLVVSADDYSMTAASKLRGDHAPRCLGMLETAASILMFAWQHPAGAESELLDRLIEVLDAGSITYLFRALTFKMDWESRDRSAGAMKARAAACRLSCCIFGIALTDETSIGMRRLMDSCDADQASRRSSKGPRNIIEAVLTALQTSLTHAHRLMAGGVERGLDYHSALFELVESALLATGSICGSSVAPGGSDGVFVTGDDFLAAKEDEFADRRKEVCKVACDIVIRGGRSGPALLPTMLVGGFGEGAVSASLRLALAIAQNGSPKQHAKLASSGILVPVSDILKAALGSGDIYRFSAALALVRFCGPHVASGVGGGIQAVRDAISVATNVLTLPTDPGASQDEIDVQESLKADCMQSIESLSKNAALWSAISSVALPSMIHHIERSFEERSSTSSDAAREAALRAVLEIVQVPSHCVFAAECGLADSLGKLVGYSCDLGVEHSGIIGLAIRILFLLVSNKDSRRHCNLFTGQTLRSVCHAVGISVEMEAPADTETASYGIQIIHFVLFELHATGSVADVVHSPSASFFVDSIGGPPSFLRTLCSTLLCHKTGMVIQESGGHSLEIPSTYGLPLKGPVGPIAGFDSFQDACASILFTVTAYASVVYSSEHDVLFWRFFMGLDSARAENPTENRVSSTVLISLMMSLASEDYSGFRPSDATKVSDYRELLYPLARFRLLEMLKASIEDCISSNTNKEINTNVLQVIMFYDLPGICLSFWRDSALLELSYEILMLLVEAEPEAIQQSFVQSKDSLVALFELLSAGTGSHGDVGMTDTRRFLASSLEDLAGSGALAEAVEKFDVKSSAISALAVACLTEEQSTDDGDEELTSNRLSNLLMQCLVDLCKVNMDNNTTGGLQIKASEAVIIAQKLGKKICHMVISRFLERAKMKQYDIDDESDIMLSPDVAMLCAIAQHEEALKIIRSIGGFHALAQVAGEGEIGALAALAKVRSLCLSEMIVSG